MLPIMPHSSARVSSRGVPNDSRHRAASSASPWRISAHRASLTVVVFHAASQVASANGLPPSRAQRFMSDSPYRRCSAWAAIVAPSFTERDASAAESAPSDRRRPTSPEFSMYAKPRSVAPSTSSEKRIVRERKRSGVVMRCSPRVRVRVRGGPNQRLSCPARPAESPVRLRSPAASAVACANDA